MIQDGIELAKQNGWQDGWLVRTAITKKNMHKPQILENPPIFTSHDEAMDYFHGQVKRLKEEMKLTDYPEDFQRDEFALMFDENDTTVEVRVEDAYLPVLIYEHRVIRRKNPDGTFRYVFKLGGYVPSTM